MPTMPKIKIKDCPELRQQLDQLYDQASQVILAQWALKLAEHILELAGFDDQDHCAMLSVIQNGFSVNQAWQQGKARMHDVRQAGFQIHQVAKHCKDAMTQAALRVAGQAVGTGHMREHAMVASDYAIKVINIMCVDDLEAVAVERNWQIQSLKMACTL